MLLATHFRIALRVRFESFDMLFTRRIAASVLSKLLEKECLDDFIMSCMYKSLCMIWAVLRLQRASIKVWMVCHCTTTAVTWLKNSSRLRSKFFCRKATRFATWSTTLLPALRPLEREPSGPAINNSHGPSTSTVTTPWLGGEMMIDVLCVDVTCSVAQSTHAVLGYRAGGALLRVGRCNERGVVCNLA